MKMAEQTKTIVFLDWADGVRGPGWYETGWMRVPASEEEIQKAEGREIVEIVRNRRK